LMTFGTHRSRSAPSGHIHELIWVSWGTK
jgi:hypothetical protein